MKECTCGHDVSDHVRFEDECIFWSCRCGRFKSAEVERERWQDALERVRQRSRAGSTYD